MSTIAHCGRCNDACPQVSSNQDIGDVFCNAGACYITCKAGRANCDGDLTNGCEVEGPSCFICTGASWGVTPALQSPASTTLQAVSLLPVANVSNWNDACQQPTYTLVTTAPEVGGRSDPTNMGQQPLIYNSGGDAAIVQTSAVTNVANGEEYILTYTVDAGSGDCVSELAPIIVDVNVYRATSHWC